MPAARALLSVNLLALHHPAACVRLVLALPGVCRDLRVEADLVDSLSTHPNVSVSEDGASYVYRSNIQVGG